MLYKEYGGYANMLKSRILIPAVATALSFSVIFAVTGCEIPKVITDLSQAEETAEREVGETDEPGSAVQTEESSENPEESVVELEDAGLPQMNPDYIGKTAEEICAMLTIEQKASQMVQAAVYQTDPDDMAENDYSSVLSTYSLWPEYTAGQWLELVNEYQAAALSSEAGIPFVYGQDSVHGVNYADGCVIFPHNINLGAANDPELAYEIGVLTGSDIVHTGMIWNFAPCVAQAADPRWGRTYESYSTDTDRVISMSTSYVDGLLSQGVIACAKHFLGDGDVLFGTGENSEGIDRLIDRGDAVLTEEQIEERLSVYEALIETGVQTIMLSHSSLNGIKMHENEELISRLKNELGFEGFIVSDWNSLQNISGITYRDQVINCVNSGCDMLMEVDRFEEARDIIVDACASGEISQERIDDAVTRILRVKINAGLFDDPYFTSLIENASYEWNSEYSHEVARRAASASLVPIKDGGYLTIERGMRVFVTGPAADDTGVLCGGWTYVWDSPSDDEAGLRWVRGSRTILEALEEASSECGFTVVTDPSQIDTCDMVVLCLGEQPYAEWNGDAWDLSITGDLGLPWNEEAIVLAENSALPTLTLIVSGRNVILDDYIGKWNSVVMCYLPGSEGGHGIADVLTGQTEYTGTLPMPFYSSVDQIGSGQCLYDVGYSAVGG